MTVSPVCKPQPHMVRETEDVHSKAPRIADKYTV